MNQNIQNINNEIKIINQEIIEIEELITARSKDIADLITKIKGYLKEGEKYN